VQHDITPFLLSHSHLVSCSLSEGLPITFFEAKLAGMKILTTPSGGGSEILNHFDTLLSDYNQEEFEMEILRILDRGSVSLEERKTICLDSQWMQASLTTARYYEVLKEELSQFQNVRT
jgi:glycosyltransferase involved in cell wall biosynthesis